MIEVESINSKLGAITDAQQKLRYQEDDGIPLCPVFRPTEQEFSNFQGYLEKCVAQIGTIGIFKVVPPANWVARKSGYKNIKFNVKRPMEQNVQSTRVRGTYELILIDQVSRSLERFQTEAQKNGDITNGKSVQQIEKLFWKSLKNSSPIYGADVAGSMFDKGTPWNLAEIKSILNDGLGDQKIPGVTNPYVYVGSWKSMFGWHKEDMDLYSINYVHHGCSKFWYGVDLRDNAKFEDFMHKAFPESHKKCDEFIRHKTTLVQPKVLMENGIRIVKNVHNENEFMISRAAAYHSGFNFGYNIAEAVNFALPDWLKIGPKVNYCKCIDFSVSIDMKSFYQNLGLNPRDYITDLEDSESEEDTTPTSEKVTPTSDIQKNPVGRPRLDSKDSSLNKIFKTERFDSYGRSVIDESDFVNRIVVSKSILPKCFNSQPTAKTTRLLDEPRKNLGKRKPVLQKVLKVGKRQKVENGKKEALIIEIEKSRLNNRFDVITKKINQWYSTPCKQSLNIFELIQICDQLSPHLLDKQKNILNKRLDKMKLLFYEKNRNNKKSRIPGGCFNEYTSPNEFQNDVVSLYQDMHECINSNNFVECLVINEDLQAKQEVEVKCSNCKRVMMFTKYTIKIIKKYKRESILMQKKLLMRFLKTMKSVPQELKLDETKDKNVSLNCYDVSTKGQETDCQKEIVRQEQKRRQKLDSLLNTHYKKEETKIVSYEKYKKMDKKLDYELVQDHLKIIFAPELKPTKGKK